MGCRDNYQLTWADYHPSVSAALQSIRTRSELFDVTLVTANGELRAHRLILAACSPVLRELFRRHPDQSLLFLFKAVFGIRVPLSFFFRSGSECLSLSFSVPDPSASLFLFPFRIRVPLSFFFLSRSELRYLACRIVTCLPVREGSKKMVP
jgi:hypothetical protein